MQSTFLCPVLSGLHSAIIMDGNGRWAVQQGLSRSEGHREGVKTVRRIVECAPDCGISVLTLYAFSADNWKRPEIEVKLLMELLYQYLLSERKRCIDKGIRISVIGRRDRLSYTLRTAIQATESATVMGQSLHLRIAIDYSSRDSILQAARNNRDFINGDISRESFSLSLAQANHLEGYAPDVDLLIRTGGEKRLSDFLLWESAYAELYFTDRMWPEFSNDDLKEAVDSYHQRERRFGAIPSNA